MTLKALIIPLCFTLLMHGVLAAVLLFDWFGDNPATRRQAPQYISATLVTMEKPKPKVKAIKKRPPKSTPKKSIVKPKSKPVNKPAPKPKVKPAVDTAKLQQQKLKQQLEQQRIERERQQQAEQELADALAVESSSQQAETDAELTTSYIAVISQAIERNWSRPASARNNMEVELVLDLVPTGEVINVAVVKGSGDSAFDRSAVNAVKKSERFPELQDLPNRIFENNFRRFRMIFRPEDLRR